METIKTILAIPMIGDKDFRAINLHGDIIFSSNRKEENDILNIILKIHSEFPELSKYIAEMPDNSFSTDTVAINRKDFKEYCTALENLLAKYSKTHVAQRGKTIPSRVYKISCHASNVGIMQLILVNV